MYVSRLALWLLVAVCRCNGDGFESHLPPSEGDQHARNRDNLKSAYTVLSQSISHAFREENLAETCSGNAGDDVSCLVSSTQDKLGLEAIRALHNQLDDDRNGNVDLTETDEFLREELKYDSGYEKRQKAFHKNDDMHISVKELWEAWLRSEVHNWTTQQTCEWLATSVELPQYVNNFIHHNINGAVLPRLAVNNVQFLSYVGVKDPIHKQKIALKAMDVVLFGPPKDHHPHWKDLTLIFLIFSVCIGIWYAIRQNNKFKRHFNRMYKDMESLQHAECALENLQKELELAVQAREHIDTEKQHLEKKLQEVGAESGSLHNSSSDLEVSQLKAEIEMLRNDLQIAEGELKDRCWSPPLILQQWLQLTHEIENKAYSKKKMMAEKQLQQAREACEKLRKKRSSLVGAFVSTHGKSIDDVDRSIVEARTSLNEVTQELRERVHRWKQIEFLCGFNIINNSGLQHLENILYRNNNLNGRQNLGIKVGRLSSLDDLDDDTSSTCTGATGYMEIIGGHAWREADSSESEASKQEDDISGAEYRSLGNLSQKNAVHFLVGGDSSYEDSAAGLVHKQQIKNLSMGPSLKSVSNNNILAGNGGKSGNMVRSFSHEVSVSSENVNYLNAKATQSEPALDRAKLKTSIRQQTIKEQPSVFLEDDVYSTDSSVLDEEIKKRKRKLFGFTKKSKNKGD